MARFILRRCKVREDRLVPVKNEEPIEVDWDGLKALLAPTADTADLRMLGMIRPSAFVGRIVNSRSATEKTFVVYNFDTSNKIAWIQNLDESFEKRVKAVYLVEALRWDGTLVEAESGTA